MTRRLFLCDGAGRRLPIPGEYAGDFGNAVAQCVALYRASFLRLSLLAWTIEDDRGSWATLASILAKPRPRSGPDLFDDDVPRRADRGNKKAPVQGAPFKG